MQKETESFWTVLAVVWISLICPKGYAFDDSRAGEDVQ